jgi:hypothetical protein
MTKDAENFVTDYLPDNRRSRCDDDFSQRLRAVSQARLAACFLILEIGLIICGEPSNRRSVVAAENFSRSGTGLSRRLLSR